MANFWPKNGFALNDVKINVKYCITFVFSILAITLIILENSQSLNAKEILQFNRDLKNYNAKLQILNQDKKPAVEFLVAIADTEYKKIYGLMNLKSLPQDRGMIFYFRKNEVVYMWMKNTKIPLDMLFIDKNNIIVNIETDTVPESLDVISSEKPVKKVLEINGGLVKKFNIKIGQKIKILR